MPRKNEIVTLFAESYTSRGEAVCRMDGFVVFVPGMLRGERAAVRLLKVKKAYAYGKIVELLEKSPHRREPGCKSYPQCGGCQLRHMSYEEELALKHLLVSDAMKRIGGVSPTVHQVAASPVQQHYRNKTQLPVGQIGGSIATGFYAARSHRLVPCRNCLLQDTRADAASDALLRYMKESGADAYDETTCRGLIRRLYLRFGSDGRKVMVCVVTNGRELPLPKLLCRLMREALGNEVTVVQNINCDSTNVILGKEMIPLLGSGRIEDTLCGLEFVVSPHSFFQVNHSQTQRLYSKALELASLTGKEIVLDLYCGIGTITLLFARRVQYAYGVEAVSRAVENARENAVRNGIENVTFLCGDAAQAAERFEKKQVDVVIVDPPRCGCDARLIDAIKRIAPKKMVYISCNPATLARDVNSLSNACFQVGEVFPFDMFPGTAHVETIVLLQRRDT